MDTENPRITIGFRFVDHFGNEFSSSSTLETFEDIGAGDLETIGEQLNSFLSQVGYARSNTCMLMDDLTEEELWALKDYLSELRTKEDTETESEAVLI